MCDALRDALLETNDESDWQPTERRLRCIGHIINIAVQAFFFAKDKEAVELAIEQAIHSLRHVDDELLLLSEKDETAGWIKIPPLQKILAFVTTLSRSDKLYNAFRKAAGKVIRRPNDTRWNSYLFTFEDALELRAVYTSFIYDHQQLADKELTAAEWQLVEQTVQFLQPFKEATKRCEGDYVTLDKVQQTMDSIIAHYQGQQVLYRANKLFTESIVTSWYAFDKYYRLIDQTGAYTAAILLHPNRRLSYLQAAWQKDWVKPGIERARAVWMKYKNEEVDEEEDTSELTQYERWLLTIQAKQRRGKGAQDEFERFINAPADDIDIPVLDWWQETSQQRIYPQLARMAIDVLSALAMSAESERVFSATRRSIPWTRASLESRLIMQLECLKHWHKAQLIDEAFITDGDDEVPAESNGGTTYSLIIEPNT